jgi:hypothetical protein
VKIAACRLDHASMGRASKSFLARTKDKLSEKFRFSKLAGLTASAHSKISFRFDGGGNNT